MLAVLSNQICIKAIPQKHHRLNPPQLNCCFFTGAALIYILSESALVFLNKTLPPNSFRPLFHSLIRVFTIMVLFGVYKEVQTPKYSQETLSLPWVLYKKSKAHLQALTLVVVFFFWEILNSMPLLQLEKSEAVHPGHIYIVSFRILQILTVRNIPRRALRHIIKTFCSVIPICFNIMQP